MAFNSVNTLLVLVAFVSLTELKKLIACIYNWLKNIVFKRLQRTTEALPYFHISISLWLAFARQNTQQKNPTKFCFSCLSLTKLGQFWPKKWAVNRLKIRSFQQKLWKYAFSPVVIRAAKPSILIKIQWKKFFNENNSLNMLFQHYINKCWQVLSYFFANPSNTVSKVEVDVNIPFNFIFTTL